MGKESETGLTVVISGPSGAGKDETVKGVLNKLGKRGKRVVTCTSRHLRPGEVEGEDYITMSRERFEEMIAAGEFEEYVNYGADPEHGILGEYKGTTKKSLCRNRGEVVILRVDPTRAATVAKKAAEEQDETTKVIYVGVESLFVLKQRAMKRGDYVRSKFNARLREDWQVWKENEQVFREKGTVIINRDGELDKTVDQVLEKIT
jgi:guanylate kinase